MSAKVTAVTEKADLGEGPHWDRDRKVLFYVDAPGCQVRKYDPATKRETAAKLQRLVSFVIPVEGANDRFVIGYGHDVVEMTWDGESAAPAALRVLATVDDDDQAKQGNHINDAKVDAAGRLWFGTVSYLPGRDESLKHKGALYSLSEGMKVTKHLSGISLSNGIIWSLDNKTMFYIDSVHNKVDAFDFDLELGSIGNRRTAFDFTANDVPGVPDGMTIDSEGKLWIASFGGARVVQVDPERGVVVRSLTLPAPNVTSLAFGGDRLDELYVTTASLYMEAAAQAAHPDAGRTFRLTGVGASGLPMRAARLR